MHVDPAHDVFSDAAEFTVLNHAQKLGLRARRQLPNLIKKQHAAMRFLDQTNSVSNGPGEGAARVPEELGLEQLVGQGRAIHRTEVTRPPRSLAMQGPSNQLLADARLAPDQALVEHSGWWSICPPVSPVPGRNGGPGEAVRSFQGNNLRENANVRILRAFSARVVGWRSPRAGDGSDSARIGVERRDHGGGRRLD